MGKSLFQIAGELWNHSPRMIAAMEQQRAPRPTLTSEEVGDFISYLYYLNYYNEAGSVSNGRRLFSEKGCIDCHSIGGTGGRTGPALDDHRRALSALSAAQAMWNHGPQMAVVMKTAGVERPSLRGREAVDLFAFIRGRTPGDLPNDKFMLPGSPAEGRRLFTTKGCAKCHSIDGGTRSIAPGLSKTSRYRSVTEIAGAMWNHGPEIWTRMQRVGVARPVFSGNEMADIVSFLYFLRYADGPGDPVTGIRPGVTQANAREERRAGSDGVRSYGVRS
jgi:mono/diheme cytochrome c family protein